jgi:hypothetical protein
LSLSINLTFLFFAIEQIDRPAAFLGGVFLLIYYLSCVVSLSLYSITLVELGWYSAIPIAGIVLFSVIGFIIGNDQAIGVRGTRWRQGILIGIRLLISVAFGIYSIQFINPNSEEFSIVGIFNSLLLIIFGFLYGSRTLH